MWNKKYNIPSQCYNNINKRLLSRHFTTCNETVAQWQVTRRQLLLCLLLSLLQYKGGGGEIYRAVLSSNDLSLALPDCIIVQSQQGVSPDRTNFQLVNIPPNLLLKHFTLINTEPSKVTFKHPELMDDLFIGFRMKI